MELFNYSVQMLNEFTYEWTVGGTFIQYFVDQKRTLLGCPNNSWKNEEY